MAPSFWKRKLFYVGVLIMMHALYEAHGIRDVLQKLHSGHGIDTSVQLGADSLFSLTKLFVLAVEMLCGLVIAIFGFVLRKELKPARVCDHISKNSYYEQMNTGISFNHFNHRGKMVGTSSSISGNETSGAGMTEMLNSKTSNSNSSSGKSTDEKKVQ